MLAGTYMVQLSPSCKLVMGIFLSTSSVMDEYNNRSSLLTFDLSSNWWISCKCTTLNGVVVRLYLLNAQDLQH